MPNAIITGATHGIGKAIAEKLLANGYAIAICARTVADIETCKQEWQTQYPRAVIIAQTVDLVDKKQVQNFAATVINSFGEIDILVNNAGLFLPGLITDEPDGQLESMMEINVYGAYYLTRAILPSVSRNGKGHIFNICSVAGLKPYLNSGSYSITKYAMMGFSENLRQELMDSNIRVTTVCPGFTYSRSWEGIDIDTNRLMKAEDVAEMVWSACSLSANTGVETIVMRPAKGDL
jgi:short-subunit dehydrogenase